MDTYKIYIRIGFILAVVLLTSCEDVIEVDLGDQITELYAVEAKITTSENPYVYLYKSQPVNVDEPFKGVSGAQVTVTEGSEPARSITLTEHPTLKGYYTVPEGTPFKGEPGNYYTVTIEVDDATLTATDYLAKVEPIDFIRVKPSLRGDSIFLGVFTYGNEPEEMGNFYKWDIYINDTLLNNAMNLVIASDELVNGNYINGFEIFTDFHDPDSPEDREIKLNDTIQVKQNSISEFIYYYYFQMLNQSQSGGLFSVPPANIQSNFVSDNGQPVFGLFTAQDVSASNKIVVDMEIERQLKN